MSDKEEYGIEDLCVGMDKLEEELTKIRVILGDLLKFMQESKLA